MSSKQGPKALKIPGHYEELHRLNSQLGPLKFRGRLAEELYDCCDLRALGGNKCPSPGFGA